MPDPSPFLRPLTREDAPRAAALTASFGWPHRREDWATMLDLGEGTAVEQGGRLVGTALCWRFGTDGAALGAIGVHASLQGRGLGHRLMTALLGELVGRSVVLHATEAGMALYARHGFVAAGHVVQMQGVPSRHLPVLDVPGVRALERADLPEILRLDRAATGMDRSALLRALLAQSEGLVRTDGGGITGFGLRRLFGRGSLIGPVVSSTETCARALIAGLAATSPSEFIRLDVVAGSGLPSWLAGLGLADAGTVVRMELPRHPAPPPSPVRVHALASQAFG